MTERILIMGIGNPLMADEGAGVRVAELLMSGFALPDNVEVVDAGTMGLGILNLFRDRDFIVVVDAIDNTGHPPGTVVTLSPSDLAPNQVMHSLHDIRFADVLEAAMLSGIEPEAVCVGIQVGSMEQWVTELTPEVESALPTALSAVLEILETRGTTLEPSDPLCTDAVADIIAAIRTKDGISGGSCDER